MDGEVTALQTKPSYLVHLAVLTPRKGREDELLASMRLMGGPADRHHGLRQHIIGRDRQTGRFVGITVWDSEEAWSEAVAEGRQAMGGASFDMEAILESADVLVLDPMDLVDRPGGVELRQGQA
jgi:hypothetical protein